MRLGILVLLGLVGAASAAAIEGVVFSSPSAGDVLHAGRIVEIRWSGIPSSAQEMELLLSVDGGRRFPVRLTERLDRKAGSYLWRVPNLTTSRARLLIRVGIDEEEIATEPGPVFSIVSDRALTLPRLDLRDGELWVASASMFEDEPMGSAGLAFGEATDRFVSSFPREIAAPVPPGGLSTPSLLARPRLRPARSAADLIRDGASALSGPSWFPRRN